MTNNLRQLDTAAGSLALPTFLPDATRAAVRTIDARDTRESGIRALMVNVLHLAKHPGTAVLKQQGGVRPFMAWPGPVFSDSGGFQVFSLVKDDPKLGSVTARGFTYRLAREDKKRTLTPEKSIQKQFQVGADVMFCLDYCTAADAGEAQLQESVRHTVAWARRCKKEFERQLESRDIDAGRRPLLFAVVQGGNNRELRTRCCEELLETGFDGYGFGGWPVDGEGRLVEAVELTARLLAPAFPLPLHGLGIGKPENIVQSHAWGYNLFDCVLPTRDARRKRLYLYRDHPGSGTETDFYRYLYIQDDRYLRDTGPLDPSCDCYCCSHFSRAYLHHLFKIDEPLLDRLATIHNLRFYSCLMEHLAGDGP